MLDFRLSRACCAMLVVALCGISSPLSVFAASSSSAGPTREQRRQVLENAGVQINVEPGVPLVNDFALGPSRFSVSLNPGEEQTVQVQITDRTEGFKNFSFETEDFAAGADETHATTLFGAAAGPFPARTWVHPAVPSLELNFGERAFVPVTISVPKDAEPGDHYAALLLKRALSPEETTEKGFNIISRVGILFLITVKGPVVQNAQITSLRSRQGLYWFYPAFLQLTGRNDGTVYAMPSGTIQIRNILGLVVDEIPVKDWLILRGSTRSITYEWHPRFALGRYTATTNLSLFDKQLPPVSTALWMIPALPVLIVLFAIFLVSFIVQYFFSRFEITKKRKK